MAPTGICVPDAGLLQAAVAEAEAELVADAVDNAVLDAVDVGEDVVTLSLVAPLAENEYEGAKL